MSDNFVKLSLIPFFTSIGVITNSPVLSMSTDAMSPLIFIINDTLNSTKYIKLVMFLVLPVISGYISSRFFGKTLLTQYKPTFNNVVKNPDDFAKSLIIGVMSGVLLYFYPLNTTLHIALMIATGLTSTLAEIGVRIAYGEKINSPLQKVIVTLTGYMFAQLITPLI